MPPPAMNMQHAPMMGQDLPTVSTLGLPPPPMADMSGLPPMNLDSLPPPLPHSSHSMSDLSLPPPPAMDMGMGMGGFPPPPPAALVGDMGGLPPMHVQHASSALPMHMAPPPMAPPAMGGDIPMPPPPPPMGGPPPPGPPPVLTAVGAAGRPRTLSKLNFAGAAAKMKQTERSHGVNQGGGGGGGDDIMSAIRLGGAGLRKAKVVKQEKKLEGRDLLLEGIKLTASGGGLKKIDRDAHVKARDAARVDNMSVTESLMASISAGAAKGRLKKVELAAPVEKEKVAMAFDVSAIMKIRSAVAGDSSDDSDDSGSDDSGWSDSDDD